MKDILSKIAYHNTTCYILAICLLSSLFPFVEYGKYVALSAMVLMALANTYKGYNITLIALWVWAMISSIVNGIYETRNIAWLIVLLSATPMLGYSRISYNVLKAFCKLLPLFVLANLIAHVLDINYFYILYKEPNKFCFSGLTSHPQWLGAFTGLACVYTYYHAVIKTKGDRLRGVMAIVFFLMTVELGLLAGSRAALLSATITIGLMTFLTRGSLYDFIRRVGAILTLSVFLMPMFIQSVEMIEVKQMAQDAIGMSRANLWSEQLQLIKDNPIFGTGLIGGETGNGWLAVASKTGIPGAVFMLLVLYSVIRKSKELCSISNENLVLVCMFTYLAVHSCFEGYIFTPGYLGCWIFWTCIGSIITKK